MREASPRLSRKVVVGGVARLVSGSAVRASLISLSFLVFLPERLLLARFPLFDYLNFWGLGSLVVFVSLTVVLGAQVGGGRPKFFDPEVIGGPLLFFGLALALWVGANTLFRSSENGFALALGIGVLLLTLGVAGEMETEIRARWFRWTLLVLFFVRVVFELVSLLLLGIESYSESLPTFFALSAPLCFLLIIRLFGAPSWVALLGFLPYLFFLIVQWRSISLLFALMILFFVTDTRGERKNLLSKLFVVIALAASYWLLMSRPFFFVGAGIDVPARLRFFVGSNPDVSGVSINLSSRRSLWEPLIEHLSDRSFLEFLFGAGPGEARDLLPQGGTVHNDYLQMLVDFGLIGIVLLLAVLGLAGLRSDRHLAQPALGYRVLALAFFVGQGNLENLLEMASTALLIALHLRARLEGPSPSARAAVLAKQHHAGQEN